jgi:LexA-binding, inner membrane-associated putative hydrolase
VILWHLGFACALVYVTLGRRRVDYRYVLIGAIVPDLLDGALALAGVGVEAGRSIGHSLSSVLAVAIFVILVFRGERRLAVFGLAVGWLTHLVADGMWSAPETFLWPAFGADFATSPAEPYSWDLFIHPQDHIGPWLGEVAGALILWWFWVAFSLGQGDRFRLFLKDGYFRPDRPVD